MAKAINIEKYFDKFNETFSPKIVGELNGQNVLLVRCEGDKVPWHTHENEDEMFLVIEGELDVLENDRTITLHAGEFCIVHRGIKHRVVPRGHVKLLLFEPASISHTGKVRTDITKEHFDRLD
jgi:quercetin dioxygenase-like cupin family protein